MNHSIFPSKPDQPVWQLLVSLSDVNIDPHLVQEKLRELINLYNIPSDTSEKIVISIQEALLGHFEAFDKLPGERRVFVVIYISADAKERSGSNHDWGFFRIERISNSVNTQEGEVRQIEIYIY